MYAVLGVSGNTGKVVADRLLARGAAVRVVVRDAAKGAPWAARGAEVATADVLSGVGLKEAFAGAEGAYVLLPPNPTSPDFLAEQVAKGRQIADAARAAGVKHLVLLSSVAAQFPAGTGPIQTLFHVEPLLRAAVPRLTLIRAAYFMENWASSLSALQTGTFATFLNPDVPFDQIATADIGRVGADALLGGGSAGVEKIELAGARPWSPREIAQILGEIGGRELDVVQGPLDAVVPAFQSFGMSASVASAYREMFHAFNSATGDVWERDGWFVRGPTGPAQVLRGLLGA